MKDMKDVLYELVMPLVKAEIARCMPKEVYGTVTSINPLKIKLADTQVELYEEHFKLTGFVKTMPVSARVREFKGSQDEVSVKKNSAIENEVISGDITRTSDYGTNYNLSIDGTLKGDSLSYIIGGGDSPEITNPTLDGTAFFSTQGSAEIKDVSGGKYSNTISESSISVKINEEPFKDETHVDHHLHKDYNSGILWTGHEEDKTTPLYDQTTVLDMILWRGLKVGDIVYMLKINDETKYIILGVENRIPL